MKYKKYSIMICVLVFILSVLPVVSSANVMVVIPQCPECGNDCVKTYEGPWVLMDEPKQCNGIDPDTGRPAVLFIYYQTKSIWYNCLSTPSHSIETIQSREIGREVFCYLD